MAKVLRLILGDQLNSKHSWFSQPDRDVVYLMAELRQETDYVHHHVQKIIAFFLAMRDFADTLAKQGHLVRYYKIKDADNPQDLDQLIPRMIREHQIELFEYQLPDEYRLDQQLTRLCESLSVPSNTADTEHFYTTRYEQRDFFKGKKQRIMETFYRMMRGKHDIMMEQDRPLGGQWNFDQENRKKWKGDPEIPPPLDLKRNVESIYHEIQEAGITTIGRVETQGFNWPISREEGMALLDYFCKHLLKHFGDFQDAMDPREPFLFHSRLSFALNSKMISPIEVNNEVVAYYESNKDNIHISQVEGFVRQILGWREYMRGIYWEYMPEYADINEFGHTRALPDFYWTGETRMNCLKHTIGQSLSYAYAHHIQRLMVTGNFALLYQCHPDEVDAWYLGVYIDAIEWVEMPNTRGMSQFADGGIVATKPYISSGNYIQKMSNYCTGCHYSHKEALGEKACPFNALYWNFLVTHRAKLESNRRMRMMYSILDKKDPQQIQALVDRAKYLMEHPHIL